MEFFSACTRKRKQKGKSVGIQTGSVQKNLRKNNEFTQQQAADYFGISLRSYKTMEDIKNDEYCFEITKNAPLRAFFGEKYKSMICYLGYRFHALNL